MALTAEAIQSAIESYTGLSWSIEESSDELIVLSRASNVYEFKKRGGAWEMTIYTESDGGELDEMCSLSPVPEDDVLDDIRKLTPKKLQRK